MLLIWSLVWQAIQVTCCSRERSEQVNINIKRKPQTKYRITKDQATWKSNSCAMKYSNHCDKQYNSYCSANTDTVLRYSSSKLIENDNLSRYILYFHGVFLHPVLGHSGDSCLSARTNYSTCLTWKIRKQEVCSTNIEGVNINISCIISHHKITVTVKLRTPLAWEHTALYSIMGQLLTKLRGTIHGESLSCLYKISQNSNSVRLSVVHLECTNVVKVPIWIDFTNGIFCRMFMSFLKKTLFSCHVKIETILESELISNHWMRRFQISEWRLQHVQP